MEFFWLLVGVVGAAIAPSAIVGSAIGGIVSNPIDAAVDQNINRFRMTS